MSVATIARNLSLGHLTYHFLGHHFQMVHRSQTDAQGVVRWVSLRSSMDGPFCPSAEKSAVVWVWTRPCLRDTSYCRVSLHKYIESKCRDQLPYSTFQKGSYKETINIIIDWNNMLNDKTATKRWNFLKYLNDSAIGPGIGRCVFHEKTEEMDQEETSVKRDYWFWKLDIIKKLRSIYVSVLESKKIAHILLT